jgi:hypothetical protein
MSDKKKNLLKQIEELGKRLPKNMPTLDQLINELGEPENVAEMTSQSLEL